MAAALIWGGAFCAFIGFLLFYDGVPRPLSRAEVEEFMAEYSARLAETGNDPDMLRTFLLADDGREFIMLNMVRTPAGLVAHPESGVLLSGEEWLELYTRPFLRQLFRRAGHPVYAGRKIGGYIDAWGVTSDPGWTVTSTMRYRSRRDLLAMVRDPAFASAHPNKLLGIDMTFSFPTRKMASFYASPRITVALALALVAALAQLLV